MRARIDVLNGNTQRHEEDAIGSHGSKILKMVAAVTWREGGNNRKSARCRGNHGDSGGRKGGDCVLFLVLLPKLTGRVPANDMPRAALRNPAADKFSTRSAVT